MAITLHRCNNVWVKVGGHPCWRVQKALDDAGVEYQVVKEPLRRNAREETVRRTGQSRLPWLELADGTALRDESAALARRIHAGELR